MTASDLDRLLARWRAEPSIGGNISKWHKQPARPGEYAALPEGTHPRLATAFSELGYEQLYSHQAESWQQLKSGKNAVIVTSTASGKTLCYNLPVLDALLRDPEARALYLFPTKALAHDQSNELNHWLQAMQAGEEIAQANYDGDTSQSHRPAIRKKARILFSNPDMLHLGILPYHTKWAEYFTNLRYVVIDEMHSYRGVFGSHVANIIRRLKRVARFYGAAPQFVLSSATIANPQELAEALIEEDVALIDRDGSPRGPRHFLIYNPPIVNADLGLRASLIQESVRLSSDLIAYDTQSIIFARTRRSVEIMLATLRNVSSLDKKQLRGYRSGYLAADRRQIESGLRSGEVRAVVTTNALELGVDIGGMSAAVLTGYPGTVAATWQQAGRAGRGEESALAVLLTSANPLDQFLARHPEYLLSRSPEHALINPNNLLILLSHIRCAAYEMPFRQGEAFGKVDAAEVKELLDLLVSDGQLHASGDKYFWMSEDYPADQINLRGASSETVLLQAEEKGEKRVIGQIDLLGAHWMVHPEAIYIHEGRSYFVKDLDLEEKVAHLHPSDADYYTSPQSRSTVSLIEEQAQAEMRGSQKFYGDLAVATQVVGFQKLKWFSNEIPGSGVVDLPPVELRTTGYWFALEDSLVDSLREKGLWSNDANEYGPNWQQQKEAARERDEYTCQICGLPEDGRAHDVHHINPFRSFASHKEANRLTNLITLCRADHRRAESAVRIRSGLAGLSFALRHLAPLFLMCDIHDIGVEADPKSDLAEGKPVVVIFDYAQDAMGFSQRLFELHDELIRSAYELVVACECNDGCPSCVGPGGELGQGSKKETLAILEALNAN
jgi:DEAD/DEAH box helicase domain-containing protein